MRLVAHGIGHGFGGRSLFRDINFDVGEGEMLALLGPSGSGKSTLLSIIAGATQPQRGRISRQDLLRVRWVFQNPHGVAQRSALDHVALPLLARGESHSQAKIKALMLLNKFQIGALASSPFRALSGGEGQRLMLARALASQPDLLLVDEPTAQLDPESAGDVAQVLHEVRGAGSIVVVATHDSRVSGACTARVRMGLP